MKKHTISQSTIDYRNARYQGSVNSKGNRQSLGILVDDDLSFYVSHWSENLLDGQTLVYISHGKYIYGQWLNNEPHGLNVFRTGDTVMVGDFRNGKIISKVLVIFERYNTIAILEARNQKDKFDVLQCGKLTTHNDLLKYIDLLDVQMPDHYFSLIKFVTSLTSDDDESSQALIASPCEGQNCYFGFIEGLAIIFNSNNGVVSVGQHESRQLSGFGGKFDGKKIEEGNFETDETITYQKKRPDNQINAIFQKMHKRSLNFKNQYFDSKLKTLKDLQNILRGNIQKIINQNIKNGIRETTVEELNDSLDYQNLQNYESIKTAENRQNMYEKEPVNIKKTTSQYYRENKCFSKSPNPVPSESTSRKANRINVENQSYSQSQVQETARRTPVKDSSVNFVKKSPIRYKEQDRQAFGKESKNSETLQNYEEQSRTKKYFAEPIEKDESKVGKTYKRGGVYEKYQKPQKPQKNVKHERNERPERLERLERLERPERPERLERLEKTERPERSERFERTERPQRIYDRSPLNHSKNMEAKTSEKQFRQKIPKFGGLQMEEKQKPFHKSNVQNEVQQYKRQLQKSRSREKSQGKSLGKCLKRPNYEDIEDRRKRLLNQFKQLNVPNSQSKISTISQTKTNNRHKASLEIEITENSRQTYKKIIDESPCMKQKITSLNSDTDMNTSNSVEGCLPLSLLNAQKPRKNRNQPEQLKAQISASNASNASAFSKKQSLHERSEVNKGKTGKQNVSYTPGSFTKSKKETEDEIRNENYVNEKKNQIRRFYCQESEGYFDPSSMTKKNQSKHTVSQNQEEDDNQFAEIQLKHQMCQKIDNHGDKKYVVSERMVIPSRSRQQIQVEKQANYVVREPIQQNRQKAISQQRDLSPSIVSEVSRRKTGYKFYFDE